MDYLSLNPAEGTQWSGKTKEDLLNLDKLEEILKFRVNLVKFYTFFQFILSWLKEQE